MALTNRGEPGRERARLVGLVALFLLLAWPGAGQRGVTSEEVQPYLRRHPAVVELSADGPRLMPPYEPAHPPPPRWVATAQWPVLAYDGQERMWPVFIRGHQTALGSYVGLLLGPWLGGGIAGLQRSSVLLSCALLPLTWWLALRSWTFRQKFSRATLVAPLVLALSFGTIFFGRTGYAFELASRVAMVATLAVAAPLAPLTTRRAVGVGALAALAVCCRATIALTLAPALALLLAHPGRVAPWRTRLLVPALLAALPVAVVAALTRLAPFHEGTAPLAGFPLAQLPSRLLDLPGHLLTQLAYLGDPQSILGPLRSGSDLRWTLPTGAALALLPVGAACARWWRGQAGDGERMLVAGLLGNVMGGALMYGDPGQFQLAMALDPLLAVALAEQVAALGARRTQLAGLALAAVVAARAQGVARGLWLDARGTNPMFSGQVQRGVVARLRELGVRGPEVMTTTYNQAGVIEAWTEDAVRPLNAWPALKGESDPASLRAPMRLLLETYRPRFVLLTEGENAYEGPFTDNVALRAAVDEATRALGGRVSERWAFPTETGAPGWVLWQVELP